MFSFLHGKKDFYTRIASTLLKVKLGFIWPTDDKRSSKFSSFLCNYPNTLESGQRWLSRLVNRVNCLSDWPIDRPTDCLSVSVWRADWLTDWLTLCESMSTSCTASIVLLNSCSSSSCCLRWIVCSARCLNEDWSSSRIKSCVVQKYHFC